MLDTPGLDGHILLTDGGINLRNDRSGAIGYEFTVRDTPLSVASLGMWDDGAADYINHETKTMSDGQTSGIPDGLATEHVVRLFDGATRELIASVAVNNDNSYLDGEFRYVDLPTPVSLAAGQTYAMTVDTAPNDRDLFHHFAAYSAVSPRRSDRVGNFVARVAATDGAYPDLYPDGADGVYNRHPDMFRHRMFVGPNARLVSGSADRSPDGAPTYDAGVDRAIFLWREADNTWRLRATAGGPRADYAGSITADRPFAFVQPFSLESTDFIDLSDPKSILFQLIATQAWQDGVDFSFPADANVCVDLQLPDDARVLVGAARTPVAGPFNLTDFGPCVSASGALDPDGAPAYDPGTEKAVFLWREPDRSWRLRATGGGEWTEYSGSLSADKPFAYLEPFSVENKDLLDRSNPKTAVFDFGMTNAGEDGLDFAIAEGTGVCVDVQLPAEARLFVGAGRKQVAVPFDLADFGPCN